MSLESMKARLGYRGGAAQQDRMIKDKYKSMLSATKYSYQAARFSKYPNKDKIFPALFNRESVNMDADTKVISTGFENNVHVGDVLYWENDKSYWICYAQERSELAYFRGHCRKCDYKVEWIDKDRHKRESYMSVVGPTQPDFRTFNPGFGISIDTPTADLVVLVTDNDQNAAYFEQYQHFIIRGVTYKVHQVDYLSMPGVRQLFCKQDYSELIDDDVEENLFFTSKKCVYEKLCSLMTEAKLKEILGENLRIFSENTDSYWKDIEPNDKKKYMVLMMSSGAKVRSLRNGGEELNAPDVKNRFVILNGIDYKNNYNYKLHYMEV